MRAAAVVQIAERVCVAVELAQAACIGGRAAGEHRLARRGFLFAAARAEAVEAFHGLAFVVRESLTEHATRDGGLITDQRRRRAGQTPGELRGQPAAAPLVSKTLGEPTQGTPLIHWGADEARVGDPRVAWRPTRIGRPRVEARIDDRFAFVPRIDRLHGHGWTRGQHHHAEEQEPVHGAAQATLLVLVGQRVLAAQRMKFWLGLTVVVAVGCGVQDARSTEVDVDQTGLADGPLVGTGRDSADRTCQLVLREVTRGATQCPSGMCWWTWKGSLQVGAGALTGGATPHVLYKNLDASSWSTVAAKSAGNGRYTFELTRDTLRDGMSATALSRAQVKLIPYLLLANGDRVFDHNRRPGDFDDYALRQADGWSIAADASCPTGGAQGLARTLDFQAGFRTRQSGALVAGEAFTVKYAIDRLPTCRGTHNGFPAWDVRAFVRFSPSGEVFDGTVRGFDSPSGVPSNAGAKSVPLEVRIPVGTTRVELWFKNSTGAGSSCESWDSAFGENYGFDVLPRAPSAVAWVGRPGSNFSRQCSRLEGAPDEQVLDSYIQQRACAFVESDVYVPGLTDGQGFAPESLFAQAELKLDGVAISPVELTGQAKIGNDWRYRFELPKSDLFYGPRWDTLEYTLRFSSDGRTWERSVTRRIRRDASFCNPAWDGC